METKDYDMHINAALLLEAHQVYQKVTNYKLDVPSDGKFRFSFIYEENPYIVIFNLNEGHFDFKDSICSCGKDECIHRYIAMLLYCTKDPKIEEEIDKDICEMGHIIDMLSSEERSEVIKSMLLNQEFDKKTLNYYIGLVKNGLKKEIDNEVFIKTTNKNLESIFDTIFYHILENKSIFYILETELPKFIRLFSPYSISEKTDDPKIIHDLSIRSTKKVLERINSYFDCLDHCYSQLLLNLLFYTLEANPETFELVSPLIKSFFNSSDYLKLQRKETLSLEKERARVNEDYEYEEALLKLERVM